MKYFHMLLNKFMKPICKEWAFEAICDPTENYIMFNQISDVKCNLKFKLFKLTCS